MLGGSAREGPDIVGVLDAGFSVPTMLQQLAMTEAHKVVPLLPPMSISTNYKTWFGVSLMRRYVVETYPVRVLETTDLRLGLKTGMHTLGWWE